MMMFNDMIVAVEDLRNVEFTLILVDHQEQESKRWSRTIRDHHQTTHRRGPRVPQLPGAQGDGVQVGPEGDGSGAGSRLHPSPSGADEVVLLLSRPRLVQRGVERGSDDGRLKAGSRWWPQPTEPGEEQHGQLQDPVRVPPEVRQTELSPASNLCPSKPRVVRKESKRSDRW